MKHAEVINLRLKDVAPAILHVLLPNHKEHPVLK